MLNINMFCCCKVKEVHDYDYIKLLGDDFQNFDEKTILQLIEKSPNDFFEKISKEKLKLFPK